VVLGGSERESLLHNLILQYEIHDILPLFSKSEFNFGLVFVLHFQPGRTWFDFAFLPLIFGLVIVDR
jgi:hypothetical protein